MEEAALQATTAFGAAKLNGAGEISMIGGCLMIHLSGPSRELKERLFQFYHLTNTAAIANSSQWAPLDRGDAGGAYFATDRDEGPASTHFDSGGSSFNNDADSSEDQTWPTENKGLELVSLLASCAESIANANVAAVDYFLCRLGELASPVGPPIHRLAAYFTEALALRAAKLWPIVFAIHPPIEITDADYADDGTAIRLLDRVTPIPKFIHLALNAKLLEVFQGKERVHIIDFDIKEGLQWPGLLQSLAARPNPPTHVRITGVGDSRQELHDTGVRLKSIAESLNLRFEFHPVVDKLPDVRLWMLHVKEHECVAVNCVRQLHRLLGDDQMGLAGLLSLIRSANAAVVTVAEEEAEHNGARWEARFANALRYYAAVFDAVESSRLPEASATRARIEEAFAARIRNVVACEGRERVERHEGFGRWREAIGGGGFGCVRFGEIEEAQCRMLLRMYASGGDDYGLERRGDGEALTLKYVDQPLYTVSAWAPTRFEDSCTTAASRID